MICHFTGTPRAAHADKCATPLKFLKYCANLTGTVGHISTWFGMERQTTYDADDEREHLRRLRDELFSQPPLETFDEPRVRWAVARVIERALIGPQPARRTAR